MAAFTAEISNLIGQPAVAVGTTIRLASGWLGIDEACGGIRSLQACFMIGLFFGEWYRFSLGRRVALIGVGVAAALLGSFSRVMFLGLRAGVGIRSMETVHDYAGWIAMVLSLALTSWLACKWAEFRWPEQRLVARSSVVLVPAWRWIAVVVILLAGNEVLTRWWFAHGEKSRASIPQWTAKLPESHWSFHRDPLSETARDMLRPDYYFAGHWQAATDKPAAAYYVVWQSGQVARFIPFLHNPTVCLPLSGCELVEKLNPINIHWVGGEIPFFAYKFRRLGDEMIIAFTIWDPERGQMLNRTDTIVSQLQWWRRQWTDVKEARQNQPAQLLTVSLAWEQDARGAMQTLLEKIIVPASPH